MPSKDTTKSRMTLVLGSRKFLVGARDKILVPPPCLDYFLKTSASPAPHTILLRAMASWILLKTPALGAANSGRRELKSLFLFN